MHTRSVVKAVVGGKMGNRKLTAEDVKKVLAIGGLENCNQITWDDIAYMYTQAAGVLRARCASPSHFSWARACPLALLGNTWSAPGFAHSVDGSHLVPLNHHGSTGVGIERKRLVMCVAAHLSPFYAHVFRSCFAAARVRGKKRRSRAGDPFTDAKKMCSKKRKKGDKPSAETTLTKEEAFAARVKAAGKKATAAQAAATKTAAARAAAAKAAAIKTAAKGIAARVAAAEATNIKAPTAHAADAKTAATAPPVAAANAVGACAGVGVGRGPIVPMANEPLCVLVRASERLQLLYVWRRQPTPLLPASAGLSVVPLSGLALSNAARASVSVRVVLPRHLLKDAFVALNKAKGSVSLSSDIAVYKSELALRLTVEDFDPVLVFSQTLMQMSSILSFNESITSSRKFLSWINGLSTSSAYLPAPLDFWSRSSLPVGPLAEAVCGNMAGRLLGDCVWAVPRVEKSAAAARPTESRFGGCSVNVQDILDAGQKEYMTNALLDAGMTEVQRRCSHGSTASAVLSCTQSASFTSIGGEEVSLERAMSSIVEVMDTWDSSLTRFVMLLNIDDKHWISASISLTTGCVTVYDSAVGFCAAKRRIASRLLLFARQAEIRWRTVHVDASVGDIEWKLVEANKPARRDDYNCGLFAFAHIWCSVHGLDFSSLPFDGDHLRLSLIYFVLMNGLARDAPRLEDTRATRR